jgi:transcriptional regulator with XRE-family HTH domain
MLSPKLKALRSKKKVSQEAVAEYLEISKSAYGYYESGRNMPSVEVLLKLAKYFDVSTDYLLGREPNTYGYPQSWCGSEVGEYFLQFREGKETKYGQGIEDTDDILNRIKDDPATRMVAKISGDLTDEGRKDLLKYAELLRNQRDSGGDD